MNRNPGERSKVKSLGTGAQRRSKNGWGGINKELGVALVIGY
jgi:hypothetical protein